MGSCVHALSMHDAASSLDGGEMDGWRGRFVGEFGLRYSRSFGVRRLGPK